MAESKGKKAGSGRKKSANGKKKYRVATREKCMMMVAEGFSVREISKQTGVPTSTINSWKKASYEDPEELQNLRLDCARTSAREAFDAHRKSMRILNRQLDRALEQEKLLDEMIEEFRAAAGEGGLSQSRAAELADKLEALKLNDAGTMSKVSEAMYKQAQLAVGGATERVETVHVQGFDEL